MEDVDPDVSGAHMYFGSSAAQRVRPQEFRVRVVPSFEIAPDILATRFWQEYDPRAHYQGAILFEELYPSCPEPEQRLNFLARALYTSFLSFQFDRCAQLGTEIPPDQEVTQTMLAHLPPGNGLEYYRRLAEAAKAAAELEETAPEYHVLAGVILRSHNFQRFDHLIRYPEDRPPRMGAEDFREWRQALAQGLAKDWKRIEAIGSDALRSFLAERIERCQQRLAESVSGEPTRRPLR